MKRDGFGAALSYCVLCATVGAMMGYSWAAVRDSMSIQAETVRLFVSVSVLCFSLSGLGAWLVCHRKTTTVLVTSLLGALSTSIYIQIHDFREYWDLVGDRGHPPVMGFWLKVGGNACMDFVLAAVLLGTTMFIATWIQQRLTVSSSGENTSH